MEERICPECNGKQKVLNYMRTQEETCQTCLGSGRVGAEDFSADVVESIKGAWNGVSWTPEEREKSFVKDYNLELWTAQHRLEKLAKTEAQKALIPELFAGFRERYRRLALAWIGAKSRVVSSAIAGPANFPAARMQKRADTEHRRLNELLDFVKGSPAYFEKRMRAALTPEELVSTENSERWRHLRHEVLRVAAVIINPEFYDLGLFRRSLAEKIRRSPAEAARKALDLVREIQSEKGIVIFATNNAVWKAVDEIEATTAAKSEQPAEVKLHDADGISVVRNNGIDRLQVFFPSKPEEAVRDRLKMNGFHWSPREGAWQRKATPAAELAARAILGVERWEVRA